MKNKSKKQSVVPKVYVFFDAICDFFSPLACHHTTLLWCRRSRLHYIGSNVCQNSSLCRSQYHVIRWKFCSTLLLVSDLVFNPLQALLSLDHPKQCFTLYLFLFVYPCMVISLNEVRAPMTYFYSDSLWFDLIWLFSLLSLHSLKRKQLCPLTCSLAINLA